MALRISAHHPAFNRFRVSSAAFPRGLTAITSEPLTLVTLSRLRLRRNTKDTKGTRNISTKNVRFEAVRCGTSDVLRIARTEGLKVDDAGIWGAGGGMGRGVDEREGRCATTGERDRRDCVGVCVRGVGVSEARGEDMGRGRGVSGTAVCVELDDVELELDEGLGEGARTVEGFGVGVRLEDNDDEADCR